MKVLRIAPKDKVLEMSKRQRSDLWKQIISAAANSPVNIIQIEDVEIPENPSSEFVDSFNKLIDEANVIELYLLSPVWVRTAVDNSDFSKRKGMIIIPINGVSGNFFCYGTRAHIDAYSDIEKILEGKEK